MITSKYFYRQQVDENSITDCRYLPRGSFVIDNVSDTKTVAMSSPRPDVVYLTSRIKPLRNITVSKLA